MSYGLRVKDADSRVTLDTQRGIPKLLGRLVVTQAGSLTDNRFLQGQPWAISRSGINGDDRTPFTASVSGSVLSWSGGSSETVIFYGVS